MKIYFGFLVVFLLGIFIGHALWPDNGSNAEELNTKDLELLSKENIEIKAKLENVRKYFPQIPQMKSITGVIQSVDDSKIIVHTGISPSPFEDLPTIREVTITSSTKIVMLEQKERKQFEAEYEEYINNLQLGKVDVPPPTPTNEVPISFAQLRINGSVTVFSERDVKNEETFEAGKVIFYDD